MKIWNCELLESMKCCGQGNLFKASETTYGGGGGDQLGNENQEGLPKQLHNFTSLEKLLIARCPKVHKFPKAGLPRSLTELRIIDMKIREGRIGEWGLDLLPHLQSLILGEVGWVGDSVECIMGRDMDDDKDNASHSDSDSDSDCRSIHCMPCWCLSHVGKGIGIGIGGGLNSHCLPCSC
ncbi:hypothetical protein RDABS01_019399 [Bienertia sinuspersici]